jgi:hypothetical protein
VLSVEYKLPQSGLGSDFSQYERPLTFAETYTNRFRNINGGAERRPGMQRFFGQISGQPNLTRLHEWVSNTGTEVIMASDDFGSIWYFNTTTSAWVQSSTGGSFVRYISGQAQDKLIFVNGVDRNLYTNDGGLTFNELKAIITRGVTAGGTNTTTLIDGDITNWVGGTLASNNDIVHNVTRGGYGIVSTIVSASLTHTAIGTAGNGAGLTSSNQTSGDSYELIDYVDLAIIPQPTGNKDNVATAGPGTTTTVVAVSGVNFANTEIRRGDFIYNTTQGAIALVGTVSANVNLQQTITGQASGDALSFFKSAMPIASWIHVHYGRVYYLDSRNMRQIVISAPDDPEDVTTFQKTLETTSFSFGTQQPTGDVILTMTTFQGYFVAGGEKNLFIYKGNTPIKDTSSTTIDFTPTAFYPNGVYSRFGLGTNGSDLLHVTAEGLQAINIGNISNTTIQNNVSIPIRTELLNLITQTSPDNVQMTFYPRRSWLIIKVGSSCYVLNTNPSYNDAGQLQPISSWHLFTGPWAQQNHYFIRRNGDLISCGNNGLLYQLDGSASTDDGTIITTDLVTTWLRLEEPQRTARIKQGQYIKPAFESAGNIVYTINVRAGWDNFSSDSIEVTAGTGGGPIGQGVVGTAVIGGGDFVQSNKYPLRWRGEQARLEFITATSASPDIITGFTLYGNIAGIR